MPITNYTLTGAASASNRYTASGSTDVLLSNTSESHVVAWTTTTDDNAPAVAPSLWNKIAPLGGRAMTLPDGRRLWMACPYGAPVTAALEV